jgi:hypothetical protein
MRENEFGFQDFHLTLPSPPRGEGLLKKSFWGEVFRRDRACPCPNHKTDSHKGCPYINPSSTYYTATRVFQHA